MVPRPIRFHSLLCPVDFSEHSRTALRHAVALASRQNAALTVMYANDPLLVAAASTALHDQHMAERSLGELRAFVDAALPSTARRRLKVSCRTTTGNPPDEILKAADRYRADLIVIGTHGLTGASRLLIGSTTANVLRRTRIPVLAIPPARPPRRLRLASWPSGPIAAPVDFGLGSSREVVNAARIAQGFCTSLILVHVLGKVSAPGWLADDLSGYEASRIARAQKKLEALAAKARRYVEIDTRITTGRAAEEIAALASAERIDLLITTLHERRGWFGPGRGALSYQVLCHVEVPVLACPPG